MATTLEVLKQKSVLHAPPGKPFILKSGAESMTYVDVRLTALSHEGLQALSRDLAVRMMHMGLEPDRVAGVVAGGCPLATGVSSFAKIDALYVRPEAKDHGTGKLVEGAFTPGQTVVLFEDVITSGGSTLAAIKALKDVGLIVIGVVAVLDRQQGGAIHKIALAVEHPYKAEALFTLEELLT